MSGVSKVAIAEESAYLLRLMKSQKQVQQRERVQALYLLKSGEASSIAHVARILGHSRVTVQRWLLQYQKTGLADLLKVQHGGGRKASIPAKVQATLKQKLQETQHFTNYGEILQWLEVEFDISVNYWVVYDLVHKRWGFKLNSDPSAQAIAATQHHVEPITDPVVTESHEDSTSKFTAVLSNLERNLKSFDPSTDNLENVRTQHQRLKIKVEAIADALAYKRTDLILQLQESENQIRSRMGLEPLPLQVESSRLEVAQKDTEEAWPSLAHEEAYEEVYDLEVGF